MDIFRNMNTDKDFVNQYNQISHTIWKETGRNEKCRNIHYIVLLISSNEGQKREIIVESLFCILRN